jgi:hypothetical protein
MSFCLHGSMRIGFHCLRRKGELARSIEEGFPGGGGAYAGRRNSAQELERNATATCMGVST